MALTVNTVEINGICEKYGDVYVDSTQVVVSFTLRSIYPCGKSVWQRTEERLKLNPVLYVAKKNVQALLPVNELR